jgi:hypothetical protein
LKPSAGKEVIEILDSDSENDAGGVGESSPVAAASSWLEGGKEAWKGLMSRMQAGQKKAVVEPRNSKSKGVKRGFSNPAVTRTNSSARGNSDKSKKPRFELECTKAEGINKITTLDFLAPRTTTGAPASKWIPGTVNLVSASAQVNEGQGAAVESRKKCGGDGGPSFLFEEEDLSSIQGWSGDETEIQLNVLGNEFESKNGTGKKVPKNCPFYKKIPGKCILISD